MNKQGESNRIFGVNLCDVMARPTQKVVPTVVKEMFLTLQKNGLMCEGIFRKASPNEDIMFAKKYIDIDGSAADYINKMDPYLAASILKLYFKELPGSLLTYELYNDFIASFDNVEQLRTIIQFKLPVPNKKLTEVLILFVGLLLDNVDQNRLSPNDIAVIFSSILIRPEIETIETVMDNSKRFRLVLVLSKNYDKIFPEQQAIRSIIKKHEPPTVYKEKQHLKKYKDTLKTAIRRLSGELDKLSSDLDTILNIEDVTLMANTLKEMSHSLQTYCNQKMNTAPSKSTIDFVCTTLLESGHSSLKGPRPTMEDRITLLNDMNQVHKILSGNTNRAFFGVYDGHTGDYTAELASTIVSECIANELGCQEGNHLEAMRLGIIKADEEICTLATQNGNLSGATLAVCMIVGETLYVANLGDSEIVLCERSSDKSCKAIVLSQKHKPSDDLEKERITSLGGIMFRGRILGKLAVSRALGDIEYKYPKSKANFVSNDPYVNSIKLNESHDFFIVACDGLWDKVNYQEAVDYVIEQHEKGKTAEEISLGLCHLTLDKGSKDNVTVIVVFLKWRPVQT